MKFIPVFFFRLYYRTDAVVSAASDYESERQHAGTPFTKVAQTQTDYRDTDTQTDPYSPDYVVQPGTKPELLSLALLAFGSLAALVMNPSVIKNHLLVSWLLAAVLAAGSEFWMHHHNFVAVITVITHHFATYN